MVKRRQVGVWFPSSLKVGVGRVLPGMWGCFQRLPPALFGIARRIEGGGMTLLLRHSSGVRVLGAESQCWDWLPLWFAACCSGDVHAAQWSSAQRALELTPGGLHGPTAQWGAVWRHDSLPEKIRLH